MVTLLRCTDYLFRGPQPSPIEWLKLRDQGIRTVVNLRSEDNSESYLVTTFGMQHVYIPIEDWTVPSLDQVWQFIHLVADDKNHAVFVHCLGGVGRTGTLVSCYRVYRGMTPQEAIDLSRSETIEVGFGMNASQEQFVLGFDPSQQLTADS